MTDYRGFTVVEVLISLLVFAVGLLATLAVFASSTRTIVAGQALVNASARAADVLEAVRGSGCGGLSASSKQYGDVVVSWKNLEMGPDLLSVTVVVSSASAYTRPDTFTAFVPC